MSPELLNCFPEVSRSPLTFHLLGPAEAKDLHELVALSPGALAQASARQRHAPVLRADGRVQGAEESSEVGGALQVHHGVEGLRGRQRSEVRSTHQGRYDLPEFGQTKLETG